MKRKRFNSDKMILITLLYFKGENDQLTFRPKRGPTQEPTLAEMIHGLNDSMPNNLRPKRSIAILVLHELMMQISYLKIKSAYQTNNASFSGTL